MKYAYLTCELLGRDLDSRLLIAAHLVSRGINCIVGQQWAIFANLARCPKGVVLFKTANEVQGGAAREARRCGHRVVISDEEVLSAISPEIIARVTSKTAVECADLFLALDERHRSVVNAVGPTRCEVVGNARVDLLMGHASVYRGEADQARKAGPYILFNTSFSITNSVWGSSEHALAVGMSAHKIDRESDKAKSISENVLQYEAANLELFKQLIPWLKENFDYRIVIRPHPSEKSDTWRAMPGVEVVEKTNPIPWMMGAELMIHTSSATGIEAALLGTPCLNVVAAGTNRYADSYLAQEVNHTVQTADEAKAAITAFLSNRSGPLMEQRRPGFLAGGAEKAAALIAPLALDGPELRSWKSYEPRERQVEKFSISLEDFVVRMKRIFDAVKVKSVQVGQLDRALFLLVAESDPVAGHRAIG